MAQWKMISSSEFTKDEPPYFVRVTPGFDRWVWVISDKDNNLVDCAMYHNNCPTSELDAKVKADKVLHNLLKIQP